MKFPVFCFILLETSALFGLSQRQGQRQGQGQQQGQGGNLNNCAPGVPGCLPPYGLPNQNFGPTPACSVRSGSCMTTQCVEEGPYYKAGSPIQQSGTSSFIPQVCQNSVANDRIFMNGTVRIVSPTDPCGRPVRAMLDIWHANADGIYSDISPTSPDFSCRTRLITSNSGFFAYSSVMPGRYGMSGRFRATHVHMKITPLDSNNSPIGNTLTTQQYFAHDLYAGANDQCNNCHSDDPTLVVHVQHSYDVKTYDGTMDILLPAS